jgi:hypothetical protein
MNLTTRAGTFFLALVSFPLFPQTIEAEGSTGPSGLQTAYVDNDLSMRMASLESELEGLRQDKYVSQDDKSDRDCSCFGPGLILAADFLYLRAKRGGLDFGISDPNTDDNVQGSVEALALESNPGVRGSLGYRTVSGWDIVFSYTHFDTDAERVVVAPEAGLFWMTRTSPASFNNHAATAFATAHLNCNVFDLEAGYAILPASCLPIRLFGGFRLAAIEQKFAVRYVGGTVVEERIQDQSTQVDAYGLRAGAEAHWRLRSGWSVFGRAAGAVLMGDFSIHDTENESGFEGQGNVDVTYRYSDILPVLDAAAGISWQTGRLTWQAGYELTAFLNLDHRVNFSGAETISRAQMTNVGSDLGLEGLFARLMYSY